MPEEDTCLRPDIVAFQYSPSTYPPDCVSTVAHRNAIDPPSAVVSDTPSTKIFSTSKEVAHYHHQRRYPTPCQLGEPIRSYLRYKSSIVSWNRRQRSLVKRVESLKPCPLDGLSLILILLLGVIRILRACFFLVSLFRQRDITPRSLLLQ